MSRKDRDYISLIWKEPKTRRNYTVGELSKNGQFDFLMVTKLKKLLRMGLSH